MIYIYRYASPLGGITVASDGREITGLWFDGQKYFGAGLPEEPEERELPVFGEVKRWLDIYFGGRAPDFTPPRSPLDWWGNNGGGRPESCQSSGALGSQTWETVTEPPCCPRMSIGPWGG